MVRRYLIYHNSYAKNRQDLISYQIKTLEPLALVEVTEGTGINSPR